MSKLPRSKIYVYLGSHPLGSQGETDSDGSKETLGHVGDDDPDEEDDRVQPVVAEDEGDDEEGDSEEDGDTGDDVDEVLDLLGNGGLATLKSGGQSSNPGVQRIKILQKSDLLTFTFP